MALNGPLALDHVVARLRLAAGQGVAGPAPGSVPAASLAARAVPAVPLAARLAGVLDLQADLALYRALKVSPVTSVTPARSPAATAVMGGTQQTGVPGARPAAADPDVGSAQLAPQLAQLAAAVERLQPAAGGRRSMTAAPALGDLPPPLQEVLRACVAPAGAVLGQKSALGSAAAGDAGGGQAFDLAALKRHYLIEQRKLATQVAGLRQRLRAQLAAGPPAAQRLAALDAVLEQGLLGHESSLLARLPSVLEAACAHRQTVAAANAAPTGALPTVPTELAVAGAVRAPQRAEPGDDSLPPCLLACAAELETLLAAETQLRLLPLRGLLASLSAMQSPAGLAPAPAPAPGR